MGTTHIHTSLWIEIIRDRGFVAYPEGTPPLSINMKAYKTFHIYKYAVTNAGVAYPPVNITRWIAVFQQAWRQRHWIRRRGLHWIRARELGPLRNLPQFYKHSQ